MIYIYSTLKKEECQGSFMLKINLVMYKNFTADHSCILKQIFAKKITHFSQRIRTYFTLKS